MLALRMNGRNLRENSRSILTGTTASSSRRDVLAGKERRNAASLLQPEKPIPCLPEHLQIESLS
jgi:hypothetical protein